ncbi:MAG TPA: hypothetical protein VGN51_19340 [Acidimicrobiia bacterium]|jgi:hypothetical protein
MIEYDELLLDAYRGEVVGAALFGAMADATSDGRRRERLQALQRIEARTAARLRDLVDAAGLDADAEGATRDGIQLAEGAGGDDWPAFLAALRSALPLFLAKFERLRAIGVPDDPVLADLVAHERAVDRFAELELEGRHIEALDVLEAHLAAA